MNEGKAKAELEPIQVSLPSMMDISDAKKAFRVIDWKQNIVEF